MLRSGRVGVAVIALCLIGLGLFFYKLSALSFPLTPDATTTFWDVEAKISVEGRGLPAEVRIARAQSTEHLIVLDESYLRPSEFGVRETFVRGEADRFAWFERRSLNTLISRAP